MYSLKKIKKKNKHFYFSVMSISIAILIQNIKVVLNIFSLFSINKQKKVIYNKQFFF